MKKILIFSICAIFAHIEFSGAVSSISRTYPRAVDPYYPHQSCNCNVDVGQVLISGLLIGIGAAIIGYAIYDSGKPTTGDAGYDAYLTKRGKI